MKRAERQLAATLIAILLAAAVFTSADDRLVRRQIDNLHPTYVQQCVLDTDDLTRRTPEDCEARWQRALKP